MKTSRCLAILPFALLAAACATTSSVESARVPPPMEPGVKGGIAWLKNNDYTYFTASWTADAVTAGPRAYPATGYFQRMPDGRWKTGVDSLAVTGSRITGRNTDVTFTRVGKGIRLAGVYGGQNVDLVLDETRARAQQTTYVREPSGAYVNPDVPQQGFFLVGEAARLDAPPLPELALAALAANFGVKGWWQ